MYFIHNLISVPLFCLGALRVFIQQQLVVCWNFSWRRDGTSKMGLSDEMSLDLIHAFILDEIIFVRIRFGR